MNNRQEITAQRVKDTLEEFDRMEDIEPSPFFYTRLESRFMEGSGENAFPVRLFKPAILHPVMAAGLILAINIASMLLLFRGGASTVPDRDESLLELARQYELIETSRETNNFMG